MIGDLSAVGFLTVYLPGGSLLLSVCALSAAVRGGCVTWNAAVVVSSPYAVGSNASVVSCYLSDAVGAVSSQPISLQGLSLLSALATTAEQSAATTTVCPSSSTNTSVSSSILSLLGNQTASLLSGPAAETLSTAALIANTVATVIAGYANSTSAGNDTAILGGAGGGAGVAVMSQATFDTATSVVDSLIQALSGVSSNTSAVTANSAVASVLGTLVQSSLQAVSALDSTSTPAALQSLCGRYSSSVGQVHGLVSATVAQLNTNGTAGVTAAQALATSAFLAQAWHVLSNASDASSNSSAPADLALGGAGLGLTVPPAALGNGTAGLSATSVRMVAVSSAWAVCGQSFTSNGTTSTASVSSNIVTLDVMDSSGAVQVVKGLQQPIEFDLHATVPSPSDAHTTTPSLPQCSWYDPVALQWSASGCSSSVTATSVTSVTVHCACSHLTEFGVLYAYEKDAARLAATTSGFLGYLVLLIVFGVIFTLTSIQLGRLLHVAPTIWQLSSTRAKGEGLAASKARSRAPTGLVILHGLVWSICVCRACSMGVFYWFTTSVSFVTLSALSVLPLIANMWVYGFVIFQWSAIVWNAKRGGSAGDSDFNSSAIVRLRLLFCAVMAAVTSIILGLFIAIQQTADAGTAEGLAYTGVVFSVVFIGVTSLLLVAVGLTLVYSLTRDFASRYATKLFLIALTFSGTLLGQALVLAHQAGQADSLFDDFNLSSMLYYGFDALGHLLVLYMCKGSVSRSNPSRPTPTFTHTQSTLTSSADRPTEASQQHGSGGIHSTVGLRVRDSKEAQVRPSFREDSNKQGFGHSRSGSHQLAMHARAPSQGSVYGHSRGLSKGTGSPEGMSGGPQLFTFQQVDGVTEAVSERMEAADGDTAGVGAGLKRSLSPTQPAQIGGTLRAAGGGGAERVEGGDLHVWSGKRKRMLPPIATERSPRGASSRVSPISGLAIAAAGHRAAKSESR